MFLFGIKFTVNDMFSTQRFGSVLNFLYFNVSLWLPACTTGRQAYITWKHYFWGVLSAGLKWRIQVERDVCTNLMFSDFPVFISFFFSKGLAAFYFIAGKQPNHRDLTYTNTFCEIIIRLTLQSLKTLRLHGLWRLNSLCLKTRFSLGSFLSVCFSYIYSLPA